MEREQINQSVYKRKVDELKSSRNNMKTFAGGKRSMRFPFVARPDGFMLPENAAISDNDVELFCDSTAD